jgi:hypothetical protein
LVPRKNPQIRRGTILGVVLAIAVFLLLFAILSSQPDSPTATSTVRNDESQQKDSYIPSVQKLFTSMIESFIPTYNGADTEIRKTNVRFERKDAIARFFSGSGNLRFQGWTGEVDKLTTESDGKAYVSIKLRGSETVIETWNNSFSDSSSNTMISRNDSIYRSLMDIREGDQVTVSGTFLLADGGQDFIREASLTEQGAMTSPEFIVVFSQISKGSARTLVPVVNGPAPAENVASPAQAPGMPQAVPAANDRGVGSLEIKTGALTGAYSGRIHNTKAQLWADFGTTLQEQKGNALSGCMFVHQPLYGSGKLSGNSRTSQVIFDVSSTLGVIHFTGNREGDGITGTYHLVQAGGIQSFGEFELRRQGDLPTGFDPQNCPDDSAVN